MTVRIYTNEFLILVVLAVKVRFHSPCLFNAYFEIRNQFGTIQKLV